MKSKSFRLLLLLLLYIIGVLALLGTYILLQINEQHFYEMKNLRHDVIKSMICILFPMLYPLYLVLKKNK